MMMMLSLWQKVLRRRKKLMLELCLGVLLWKVVQVQVSLEREIGEFLS